ncbi:MAG: serine/threonine protein kinase [Burkholderiales bacterium]|nr:serine/threonine protein kinase [Burkholderiales bacterium]
MTTQHGKTLNPHAPHAVADTPVDQHPFERLTPDVVLDALASVDLWGDGRLTTLNSYENRVYLAHLDEPAQGHHAVVLKFYRPERWTRAQIEEEHAFAAELVQAEVPVVAPLALSPAVGDENAPPGSHQTLHQHAGFGFSVSPYKGGRRPELDNFEVLEWVGRFIARIHTTGAAQPFAHRPTLNATTFALESRDWLLGHQCVPLDMQSRWEAALQTALDVLAQVAPELCPDRLTDKSSENIAKNPYQESDGMVFRQDNDTATGIVTTLRLHGDCHPGNILWTPTDLPGGGPHFVDLDDARTGPAVQDLWMLLPGDDRREQTQALSALLDGYEQFRPFDRRELRLIEPLRTLRQIHYSAWLARRWADPTFPANFPWFGSSDYWAGQIHQLEEQTEAMQRPPLVV